MWPTIVSVGPLAIQSYGLFLAIGIFFGGFVWWHKGREENFKEEELMDVWLLSLLAGFLASRVWHVLTNWGVYQGNWYKMLFITKYPGLSYEGMWVGAVMMIIFQTLKRKWDLAKLLEIGVFSFLMVEVFGFLGSFLAGSSLGKETNWWWGVAFPGVEAKRHPTQLLWVLVLVILFNVLKRLEKEYRSFKWYQSDKGEAKTGLLIAVYLLSMGGLRLLFGSISEVNWWFAGGLVVAGLVVLVDRKGKKVKIVKEVQTNKKEVVKRKKKRKKKGFDFK